MTNSPPDRSAESVAEKYYDEKCYGKEWSDHETVCQVCKLTKALTSYANQVANERVGNRNLPEIVCLCGSTRFKDAFLKRQMEETLKGRIFLSVGRFAHSDGISHSNEEKVMLDKLHFSKIRLSDRVIILNVGGYIGESTRNEMAYAARLGKPITFLESPSEDTLLNVRGCWQGLEFNPICQLKEPTNGN